MGQNQKVLGFQHKKETFFQKKKRSTCTRKRKKRIEAFYKHFGTGAKEQPNKANKQVIHTHIHIYSDTE